MFYSDLPLGCSAEEESHFWSDQAPRTLVALKTAIVPFFEQNTYC